MGKAKNLKGPAMRPQAVQFDATNLAEQIERLSQYELDCLPFGVILLDRDGTVVFYSVTEAQQSGYGEIPIGQNLFEISPCMASNDFRGASSARWMRGRSILNSAGPATSPTLTAICGFGSSRRATMAFGFSLSATA